MKQLLVAVMMGCLATLTSWGRSVSLDLREPSRKAVPKSRQVLRSSAMADGVLRSFSLGAGAAEVGCVSVGDELAVALFDDVTLALTLKARMPSPLGGDVFLAEASGYEGVKNAVVIRTADGLTVNVQDFRRKKIYKVISTSSDVKIREVEAGGRSCGCDRRVPPVMRNVPAKSASVVAAQGAEPVALRNETADVCVDVLVAYDGNASAWARSNGGGVTNFAQTAVQNMNVALANTGLDKSFRFRLVGIAEVPVSTDDLDVALDSSTDGSGGWAPIKAMRDEVGADIVTVLIDTGSAYGTTGLAWSLESGAVSGFSEYAYSACAIRSVAQSHTMTHEVGHNMGCGHSDIQSSSPGPQLYDYSAGYYFTAGGNDYYTIMAYGTEGPGGDEVPYFSSPGYMYEGVAVGDAKHDNTRTISKTFAAVSQWRDAIGEEIKGGEPESEPAEPVPGLGPVPTDASSEYNGYLYDEKSGAVKGTIWVKVGKPGKNNDKASVKAVVVVGMMKVTLKGADKGKAVINKKSPTGIELVGGETCEILLGTDGLYGFYGAYLIGGSRDFFASKDKGEVAAANAVLSKWIGSFMVVWDGGSLSVSIAAKGKVKVAGTLADGKTKVSVSTVLLVGEEWSCISVAAQKANLAFVLWLSHDGQTIEAEGLGENVLVGRAGTLANGATFRINADEFAAVFGQTILPYLPNDVSVAQNGTKWTLPKAGKVVYKNGMPDESKLGANPCGLKLTFKAKNGTFKGSFKVYAEVKGKPKATTVTVAGYMINGVGYGTATVKGKGSVAVSIE